MGMTRREVLGVFAGATATGVLAACGTASSGGQPAAANVSGEIVYMTPWSGVQLDIMNEVNSLFAQKNAKIKVNVAPQPSNGYDGVVAAFAAGSAPDSLWIAGQYGPRLYDSNELIDLTDHFKVAKMEPRLTPQECH